MLCEYCAENEATVHVNEIIGKNIKAVHLCAACAKQHGIKFESETELDLSALMEKLNAANVHSLKKTLKGEDADTTPDTACPNCGCTLDDIHNNGRLGCAQCYRVYRGQLAPLFEQLHRGTDHKGTAPAHYGKRRQRETDHPMNAPRHTQKQQPSLQQMQKQLEQAVNVENYEKAAELRDRIHDACREKGD